MTMDLTFSLTSKMERLLKKIEKKQKALNVIIEEQIKYIAGDPKIGSHLKGNLREFMAYDFAYKGVALRICYTFFEEDKHVKFVYFGTRENFYQEVHRYIYG